MVSKISKSSCNEVADVLSAMEAWDSDTSSSTTGLLGFGFCVGFNSFGLK